jgi:hypothetical protein
MSALPPITTKKADIDYVGFVPIADMATHSDHIGLSDAVLSALVAAWIRIGAMSATAIVRQAGQGQGAG